MRHSGAPNLPFYNHFPFIILSEALRRSIANRGLYSAEPKDPGDACWQMLLGAFRPQTTTEFKKVINSDVATCPGLPWKRSGGTYCFLPLRFFHQ